MIKKDASENTRSETWTEDDESELGEKRDGRFDGGTK